MSKPVSFSVAMALFDSAIDKAWKRYKDANSYLCSIGNLTACVVLNELKTEFLKEYFDKNEKLS